VNNKTVRTKLTVNPQYPGLLNQRLTVDKKKISLWSFGKIDPAKPSIIGFSGWPFSAYTLWPLMSEIPQMQFIGIDIPGFVGYSPAISSDITAELIGEITAKVVSKLKLQKYGFFGISAGGAYALSSYTATTKKYGKGQNFLSMLLQGKRTFMPSFMILAAPALHGGNIAYIRDAETTKLVLQEMKKRETIIDFVYKTINTSFGKSIIRELVYRTNTELKETGEVIDIMNGELNKQLDSIDRRALLSSAEDLVHGDFRHELKHIAVPTLFITGEKDTIVPVEDTKEFASLTKGSSLEIVKDAPHLLVITHYQEVARRIERFLNIAGIIKY
jgi:pimeloyl-ACP methyl ester carboxylesterase